MEYSRKWFLINPADWLKSQSNRLKEGQKLAPDVAVPSRIQKIEEEKVLQRNLQDDLFAKTSENLKKIGLIPPQSTSSTTVSTAKTAAVPSPQPASVVTPQPSGKRRSSVTPQSVTPQLSGRRTSGRKRKTLSESSSENDEKLEYFVRQKAKNSKISDKVLRLAWTLKSYPNVNVTRDYIEVDGQKLIPGTYTMLGNFVRKAHNVLTKNANVVLGLLAENNDAESLVREGIINNSEAINWLQQEENSLSGSGPEPNWNNLYKEFDSFEEKVPKKSKKGGSVWLSLWKNKVKKGGLKEKKEKKRKKKKRGFL